MLAASLSAQKVLRLHGTYAITDFEEEITTEPAKTFGFGASIGGKFASLFEVGVEFNMLAKPWEYDITDDYFGSLNAEYTNMMAGAYFQVDIPLVIIEPYARAGAGYYMGKMTLDYMDASNDYDFAGVFGYNLGAGIDLFGFLYAEVVYHFVDQKFKDEELMGDDTFRYNHIAANAGVKFTF
jgi:hypothetical protein